jgi:acyl-CoA synthetase (AMP-forming)/AMP-acid ligase II
MPSLSSGPARNLISGYKVPRTIEFVDALPLSGAGKVLKRQLQVGP